MSFLEVRNRGLPYGSIPYQELLNKLEETNMNEEPEDIELKYDNYMRSELIDRSLEVPYLEADKTRRDSSLSKSIINLRYNGSRGEYEHPQHPELFVGFMDSDTRGLDNNPRMDQYQQQISTRMPNLEVRMGHNNTDTDHQSPWTNQSLGQCRRDIQTSLSYNTKVFTDEYNGRALNRNFVTDYDHNKKQLIYQDVLPFTLDKEATTGKHNTQYTTSSVPFVSTDIEFTPSYKNINNYCSGIVPGTKSCQKYVDQDHIYIEQMNNNGQRSYTLQQEHKIKNGQIDHIQNDQYNNEVQHNNGLTRKYTFNNTIIDTPKYDIEHIETIQSKNKLINTVSNPLLVNNDVTFYNSIDALNRRSDLMRQYNGNTLMHSELNPNDLTLIESNIQKHKIINNNNSTLSQSVFYIPKFEFQDIDFGKQKIDVRTGSYLNKTYYNPLDDQSETQIRMNTYKFTDSNKMKDTLMKDIDTLKDTSDETPIRMNGIVSQEHKVQSTNADNVWTSSNENIIGKTQHQSRTGGMEPSIIDVPKTHDFESHNGGVIIGKKLIRNDNLSQDKSYMSEDISSFN